MNNIYEIDKNIEKLKRGYNTDFLDFRMKNIVISRLKKDEYKIYYPYKDSEKVIFYVDDVPDVILYEIKVNAILKHQDIIGTLFSIGILPSMYGDILIINNHYYIYILKIFKNYLISNLIMIKNKKVSLVECDINSFKDYQRKYEIIELVVSSLRIDSIVANVAHTNRENAANKIKNKEILVNYDYPKNSYTLKENDVFSIRKFGKYKFTKVKNITKKGNFIAEIYKYC